MSSTVAGRQH